MLILIIIHYFSFLVKKGTFPFSYHILTVTDNNKTVYRVGDTITTNSSETKTLYFSDGSVSELKPNSSLTISELDFKSEEDNLLTTVKLFLSSGEILTKATSLNDGSDFEIYTSDTTAAVRGTIFSVSYEAGTTVVSVYKGEVQVESLQNSIDDLNSIGSGRGVSIETERQISTNGSVQAIGEAVKAELQVFAGLVNVANEPFVVDSFVEPVSVVATSTGFTLFASAEYNENSGVNLIKEVGLGEILNYHKGLKYCEDGKKGFHRIDSEAYLFKKNGTVGIFLDNDGYDDVLKYDLTGSNKLEDNDDWKIEMRVGIPRGDSDKHYLLNSGTDIKLYVENGKLFLNPISSTDYINVGTGFNVISLVNEGGTMYAEYNGVRTSAKPLSNDIDELIVGAWYYGGKYYYQINEIIDYLKIYK